MHTNQESKVGKMIYTPVATKLRTAYEYCCLIIDLHWCIAVICGALHWCCAGNAFFQLSAYKVWEILLRGVSLSTHLHSWFFETIVLWRSNNVSYANRCELNEQRSVQKAMILHCYIRVIAFSVFVNRQIFISCQTILAI